VNQYLLAESNRDAITGHNPDLLVTTTRQVGQASYVSYDFNREEEFRQLDTLLSGTDAGTLNVKKIAAQVYGHDEDLLARRVRSSLRYDSPYQRTMTNGRAVIANDDGTLRITGNPDEYADLVEENAARQVSRMSKYVDSSTRRLDRNFTSAGTKVPEVAERLADTRGEVRSVLSSVFTRNLELLSGGN
jgi:hypothetical protein